VLGINRVINHTINHPINGVHGRIRYMSRRKLEDRNIRKVQKDGRGSVRMTLPIEIIRTLKWRDGQKVVVEQKGETIVIRDWKK